MPPCARHWLRATPSRGCWSSNALLNTYYQTARRMGISIRYDAMIEDLVIENGRFEGVRLKNGETEEFIRGRGVVVAAGGYEANIEWLKKHWGDAADNFIIRGTP